MGDNHTAEGARMKQQYVITVGEAGNEIGHAVKSAHVSDAAAIRKARCDAAVYGGDGWYTVTADDGRSVARGGRARM
jgi:hypothetical protein